MGEIIGAGLLSHVPTIMLPKEVRLNLNKGNEISLIQGFDILRDQVFADLSPSAVIVFDTHWFSTVEFLVSGHNQRKGVYTSEELPRGMSQIPYELVGNPELACLIAAESEKIGIRCTAIDDPHLPINYPTINLAHYLNSGEAWLSMSICQAALSDDFMAIGLAVSEAVSKSDHRAVILASGGLSHCFWPLRELPKHESSDPVHIRTPEARIADEERISWWEMGDHSRVIETMEEYQKFEPEGFFGHYLMMVGAIGGINCSAKGRKLSEYENAAGTGQVHVWFDKPSAGWAS